MGNQEPWQVVTVQTGDDGQIQAYWHASGPRTVLLAHGRVYDAGSFVEYGNVLAENGFGVLRLNFRGYRGSLAGIEGLDARHLDVLGAARWAKARGAEKIVALGASMGGGAVFRAAAEAPELFDGLVGWSPVPIQRAWAQVLPVPKLVLWSAEEAMAAALTFYFQELADPKEQEVLPGSGHAQQIWDGPYRDLLVRRTSRFMEAVL